MGEKTFTRRRVVVVAAGVAAALAIGASSVIATHNFSDVSSGAFYHDHVEAIVDAGITAGCGGGKYCPDDPVTRGQMAVFLNRVGALGPGTTPVATAAKLGTKATAHATGSTTLTNDGAYHELASAGFTASEACTLLMWGHLSAFTFNFTDYRRLEVDFFVDGVAVGMKSFDDNDNVTSTFASVAATAFKSVGAGAHTISLRGKITTGTNVLHIHEPTFVAICV